MAVIPLNGTRRDSLGKGGARKARAAGHIPAVLYGHGETPVPVTVQAREFELALRGHKGGNPIVNLAVNGGEYTALVRDVQYDPLTHGILHLDFQHISLTETVEVRVNLHLNGSPTGVKDGGGILEHLLREVEVECLPTDIPAKLEIDVSNLAIGDSLHVSDLKVERAEILTEADRAIAAVVPPTILEEVAPAEEGAAAEPEVIGAKKDEEGEAEEGAKEGKEGKEAKSPAKEGGKKG